MKRFFRQLYISASRESTSWLMLLLLLVVLVPSVCLLWFMNQASQNERLAVRQKLVEAYRGHLASANDRLEAQWQGISAGLDAVPENLPAPAVFAKLVRAGVADSVICFDASGKVVYPAPALPPRREVMNSSFANAQLLESSDPEAAADAFARLAGQATNTDMAARALQAQARCLIKTGKKEEARKALAALTGEERFWRAADAQGRLYAPEAALMALELNAAGGQPNVLAEQLRLQLLDYDDTPMPASQRLFLMRQLQQLYPGQPAFPTEAAEDLAAQYVEAGPVRPGEPGLQATAMPDVWQWTSNNRQVALLFKADTFGRQLQAAILPQSLPADVEMVFLPPGQDSRKFFLSIPAGKSLPGWQIALSLKDTRLFETAADEQIASYLWIVVLVVASVVILALLAAGLLRRQMALARIKNDLVANVTHELKTPLSSMRLLVDTLLNTEHLNEETTRQYLQLIATENVRLSRLIDNFLTFSRIERNKYVFDFNEVPAGTLVADAVAAVRERFNASGCRFQVNAPPDLPPVVADAGAMVTALLNLLDNAWKYSGDDKQITFTAGVENGSVFFAIKDNGIGLAARDAKRIFQRFYQVDQRLSRTGGGCGLGLSIVKFVVTAHHGTIGVESRPDSGSTFTITVPAARPGRAGEAKA